MADAFYLLLYIAGILVYCAFVNQIVNDKAITCLHSQKFKCAEGLIDNQRQNKGKGSLEEQMMTLNTVEVMLDSTVQRIQNDSDEGLKLKIFGIPVTFALIIQMISPIASAAIAAATYISNAAGE